MIITTILTNHKIADQLNVMSLVEKSVDAGNFDTGVCCHSSNRLTITLEKCNYPNQDFDEKWLFWASVVRVFIHFRQRPNMYNIFKKIPHCGHIFDRIA